MLSGIKAHTLRIWEQRHGFVFCKRKESLHRYYDNEDLKQILQISFLYHHGYKISRIAKLSAKEISEITPQSFPPEPKDRFADGMIKACLNYDEAGFTAELDKSIGAMGVEISLLETIYPFLERIGMLWMSNQLIPAQEHFSTAIISQKICRLTEDLPAVKENQTNTTLIFAPAGEMHEIPLLVARYILKKNGLRSYYLGINVNPEELSYFCRHKKVQNLYFHLTTNFQFFEPSEYIEMLQKAVPGAKIIASGPVMNQQGLTADNVKILSSLEEVLRMNRLIDFE